MHEFEKAVEFINSKGDEVERARLQYLLAGERPSQVVVAKLFAGQRPDGGWSPFWAQDYTSLDATCFRLAQADQLGIPASNEALARAAHFLAQRQSPDGSWEEDEKVASFAPAWVRPGDLSARLYLTANCGLWLALLEPTHRGAGKAASYIQTYLDPGEGRLPGFFHTHWLAGGLWRRLDWQEPAGRVFAYLRQHLHELASSNLSWLVITLRNTGVPGDHPLVSAAAALIERNQQNDGRWISEDGPGHDVHATLEALRALRLCT
ncbi:MAG: prenyltransferase/squalene oxidase repeat-containing protein [Chloroflexota bacterium]